MQTNGANYGLQPVDVIRWLKELEREQPFVVTGVGFDHVEGRFLSAISDPEDLAQRMSEFCPDIVEQGTLRVSALARSLREDPAPLYFWWD